MYWMTVLPHWRHASYETELIVSLLRPGNIAIDVGADVGLFTVAMANAVGPSGLVLAIEPHPESQAILKLALKARHLSWVRLIPAALGCRNGWATLCTTFDPCGREKTAFSRIVKQDARDDSAIQRRVALKTLDELVHEYQLNRLDFLKIDVEGFEWDVLQGAQDCLRNFAPILLIELEDPHAEFYGRSVAGIVEMLADVQYRRWTPMGKPEGGVNAWFRKDA
jgi:FkbM family methyltransferase